MAPLLHVDTHSRQAKHSCLMTVWVSGVFLIAFPGQFLLHEPQLLQVSPFITRTGRDDLDERLMSVP